MRIKQAIGVAVAAVAATVALTTAAAAEQGTPDTRAASGAAVTLAEARPLTGDGNTGNWPPPYATERGNWPPPQTTQTGNWPPPQTQAQTTDTGNWPPPRLVAAIGA